MKEVQVYITILTEHENATKEQVFAALANLIDRHAAELERDIEEEMNA